MPAITARRALTLQEWRQHACRPRGGDGSGEREAEEGAGSEREDGSGAEAAETGEALPEGRFADEGSCKEANCEEETGPEQIQCQKEGAASELSGLSVGFYHFGRSVSDWPRPAA
jgi:hypothetical protein